jgi:hypothetical protein
MKYTLKSPAILAFLAIALSASGQASFRPGSIVTLQNDTVHGWIRDCGQSRDARVCLFKPDRKSEVVKYHPSEIKSYREDGRKYLVARDIPVRGDTLNVFTDVLLDGAVSLYFYRKDREMSYFIEKDGELTTLINIDMSVQRRSEQGVYAYSNPVGVTVPLYQDTLYALFQDSEEAMKQIRGTGYDHESLMDLTRAYINETCEGDRCITYERDLRWPRDHFGLYSGVQFSKSMYADSDTESDLITTVPAGIFYNIPLSTINDRFAFQVETVYRRFSYDRFLNLPEGTLERIMEWDEVGIPLLFNYRLSVKRFSPLVGAGAELGFVVRSDVQYTEQSPIPGEIDVQDLFVYWLQRGLFIDAGVDYALTPGLSLFANIRIQRQMNLVISNEYYNNFTFNNTMGDRFATYFAALHLGIRF